MHITARLGRLWVWSAIWLGHLTLLVIAGYAAWWFQVTPSSLADAFLRMQASKPVAVLSAVGVSVLGVLALYWRLLRWAHGFAGREWLSKYLMKGLGQRG
jgi:hypothetical protein